MKIKDSTYNFLKYFVQVFMPALTTFVGVVLTVVGCPYTESVLTIMTALTAFLGSILMVSSNKYWKEVSHEDIEEE